MNEVENILERVKAWANAGKISADQILDRFPELEESEDERIRKFLVKHVSEWIGCIEHDLKISSKDVESEEELAMFKAGLAYLERKKEQKPLMSSDGEIEDRKRDIVAAIRKHYQADYAEYLTSFLKGLSPEDNSEDEYGQEMLGIAYKLMYEHIPENLRTQEFWDSLKFMREYTGRVAIIHPYEQPVKWSEEDERMLEPIISDLRELCNCETDEELISDYEDRIAWLKSLRPQPRGEIYQTAKHDLAIKFMNYLDENRPEGRMNLSNGECEDIDKAFQENDWAKISRYIEKYGK